jgi:hypothetical protein
MRKFVEKILNGIDGFLDRISPFLYVVVEFSLLSLAAGLFIGDFIIGSGIVASVSLFYILEAKRKQEAHDSFYKEMERIMKMSGDYDESDEA